MAKFDDSPIGTLKRSGQTLVGESLGSAITFNAQCFLVQNMFEIAPLAEKKLKRSRAKGTGKAPAERAGHRHDGVNVERTRGVVPVPFTTGLARTKDSGYMYVAPVLSDAGLPAVETFSKLSQTYAEARTAEKSLLSLTTDKMAQLVPKLRIYKVEYESKAPDKDGYRRPNLDKAVDHEIIFDDFVRGATLERIFGERGGRLSGTGIKSFKWSLKGVNPADVDKNIEAEMTIHFNDVAELFMDQQRNPQTRAGRAGNASFLDLIIHAPHKSALDEFGVGLSISQDTRDTETPNYLLYDGKFFEIKAEIGWQVPPDAGQYFETSELEAIRASQTPLYLQLTQHKFNFKQDGSADLVVNYRARYANLDNRFDLFNIPQDLGINKEIDTLRRELDNRPQETNQEGEEITTALEKQLTVAENQLNEYLGTRYSKILSGLVENECLLVALAEPIQLRAIQTDAEGGADPDAARGMTTTAYVSLMDRARNREDARLGSKRSGIAAGAEGSSAFIKVMTESEDTFARFEKHGYFTKITAVYKQEEVGLTTYNEDEGDLRLRNSRGRMEAVLDTDDKGAYEEALIAGTGLGGQVHVPGQQRGTRGSTREHSGFVYVNPGGMASPDSGRIPITFFLLGDLLDIVVQQNEGFKEEIEKQRAGLITTDIEFIDIQKFYNYAVRGRPNAGVEPNAAQFFKKLKFKELSFSKRDKGQLYKSINIASLPIQYESFVEWYMNKVVKPQRQRYFINHFIRDILTDLVAPMLSARCFYGMPATNYHVSQLDFMADYNSVFSKTLYPTPGRQRSTTTYVSDLAQSRALPAQVTPNVSRTMPGRDPYRTFKAIVMTTPSMLGFEAGDYAADLKNGVYHFIVGADAGLLKSATFSRVDAPYLREARVNRDRTAGAEQLRELYNVTLKLYGAPLIKPGQYIYVSPAPIGFGDARDIRSISRMLGIGGYHLVTEVSNDISAKGYETTVKALHQALPYIEGVDLL
jgi:hypothetical protein